MNKAPVIALLPLLGLCSAAAASTDFAWLTPGARANAMGTAMASVADDPYAVFHNPAGLSAIRDLGIAAGMSRRLSPLAPLGELSLGYARPAPNMASRTYGLGYHGVRQSVYGRRDTLVFGAGDSVVIKYLQRPLLYGASVRVINLRGAQKTVAVSTSSSQALLPGSHIGFGVDAGALLSSDRGLRTGIAVTDLDFGLGRSLTTITLGNSYRYKELLASLDVKARGSYSEVFFGLEQTLFNGLLQLRAGKGVSLDGPGYLALGAGLNAYPWVLDFAASLPWEGLHDKAGLFELNVGYRFNIPSFSERLVGEAAARAGALKTQIDDLRQQKSALETSIAAYRVNKGVLETDLTLLQSRMRESEERLKSLELELIEAEYKKDQPPPKKPVVERPPEKWPKLHKVEAGDTLRSIAGKYYGNPNLWERIYEANQKHVSRGLPAEGAVLTIPVPPAE